MWKAGEASIAQVKADLWNLEILLTTATGVLIPLILINAKISFAKGIAFAMRASVGVHQDSVDQNVRKPVLITARVRDSVPLGYVFVLPVSGEMTVLKKLVEDY